MKKLALLKLAFSMIIFGTIGLFVTSINAERGFIAMLRGIAGGIFILAVLLLFKKKPSLKAIKANLLYLFLSGAAIGANWILLFESYSYTSIAVSTLCYYMAPIFVIIASLFIYKTKISLKKGVCVLAALCGMALVSGVFESGEAGKNEIIGVLLALGAAVFYATVTMLNKKLKDISSYDRTVVQLLSAGVVVLPYTLFAENNDLSVITPKMWIILAIIVIVHTGAAYLLFFSSLKDLPAYTAAIFSYLDPIVAMLVSLVILREKMSIPALVGGIVILVSVFVSEIDFKRSKTNK